jgi:hypothetical protein
LLAYGRRLKPEDCEIHDRVGEEKIEEIAEPVGRAFGYRLPEVPATRGADAFLRYQHSRNKHHKDANMQANKERIRRNLAAEKRSDVDLNAENKTDEGQDGEQTEEWFQQRR